MTAQNKATVKGYFNTGDIPTEGNFGDLVDSYADVGHAHVDHAIPIYEDGVFAVTGTAIDFEGDLDVSVTGSFVYVDVTASGLPVSGWQPAGVTWTYASADDPTFTFTVASNVTGTYTNGTRIKLTQTTDKYFIVTNTSFSAPNTTVTIYGGTDYNLENAAITSPLYSPSKAPQGFPLDPDKWAVEVIDTTDRSQSTPTGGTWYNLGSISIDIPIGAWRVSYKVSTVLTDTNAFASLASTLSTANNSESDSSFTDFFYGYMQGVSGFLIQTLGVTKTLNLAVKDTYYLNAKSNANVEEIKFSNSAGNRPGVIRAECTYL